MAVTNNIINKNDLNDINVKLEQYNKYYNSLDIHSSDKGSVFYNQTGTAQAPSDACAGSSHMCRSHVKNGAKWAGGKNFIEQANRKPKFYGSYERPNLPTTDTVINSGTSSSSKTTGHLWSFRNELTALWNKVTTLLGSSPSETNYNKVSSIGSYTDRVILTSHIDDIYNTLTDIYTKMDNTCRNYYDSQNYCSRSCQINCQLTCQVSCQHYCTNCHNQHCGLA